MSFVVVVVSLLLAVAFLVMGWPKAAAHPAARERARHLRVPPGAYRAIGIAEMAAAIGLVIGLWWRPLGVAAAAGLVVITVGATVAHRRVGDPPVAATPALVLGFPALLVFIVLAA